MAAWFQLTEVAQAAADVEQGAGKPDGTQASVLALKAAIERALAPAPS
jgi:hypothetical protein